jgi:ankyrin repeat protein
LRDFSSRGYAFETHTIMRNRVILLAVVAFAIARTSVARPTDLFTAVAAGDFVKVEKQLQGNPDLNVFTENGFTPLVIACRNGDDKMAALLIAFGADVNLPSKDHTSPLIEAARQGYAELTELLLLHGADVSYKDENQMNAFDYVVEAKPEDSARSVEFDRMFNRLHAAMTVYAESKH